jgi:hypothetical protein
MLQSGQKNIDQSAEVFERFPHRRGGYSLPMTIGASIFLFVVGAILYFATNAHVAHINLDTVGVILMIAGAAGLVLGFVQQSMWRRTRRDVLVEDRREPVDTRYEERRDPVDPRY